MLAPVLIDLGPEVPEAALRIVLDACNEAIQNGVCLPNALAGSEQPRAMAIARPRDASARRVRIEVRLRWQEETSWIVRELVFEVGDPLQERWRSVGLAIATLVGEEERQRAAELPGSEPPESELAAPAAPEPPPEPAPDREPVPVPRAARPPSVEPEPPDVAAADSAPAPRAAPDTGAGRSSIFVGVGVLAGPGFGPGPWRLGGNLRVSWQTTSGWELSTSMGYAARASEQAFVASWLSLAAGVGYRIPFSEQFSSGIALLGGAQRASFEALVAGVSEAEAVFDPKLALSLDGDWAGSSGFGLWVALNAETIGRKSRLFLTPERTVTSSPVDFSAAFGVGWRLP